MKILNSKAGVTVLEGVIALGLLAVVTAGSFGVLLSASRKSTQPDIREEMVLAVERAKDLLQVYVHMSDDPTAKGKLPTDLASGLCTGQVNAEGNSLNDTSPLSLGTHDIACEKMLPDLCDLKAKDSSNKWLTKFYYTVRSSGLNRTVLNTNNSMEGGEKSQLCSGSDCPTTSPASPSNLLSIEFHIQCNGYEL